MVLWKYNVFVLGLSQLETSVVADTVPLAMADVEGSSWSIKRYVHISQRRLLIFLSLCLSHSRLQQP